MALRAQTFTQGAVVVDLAIEDDLQRAGLVAHRLVATGQVDDGQAPVAEADLAYPVREAGDMESGRVGAPVRQRRGHGVEHLPCIRSGCTDKPDDPAHVWSLELEVRWSQALGQQDAADFLVDLRC
jgi:hypothetical protein